MNTVATVKKTVKIEHSRQSRIRCIARVDMPEIGVKAGEKFHLVRVTGSTYLVKRIDVLSRIAHVDGSVTSQILSSTGEQYTTTLRRNHQHECSCPATCECFHIDCFREAENARAKKRNDKRRAALALKAA